MFPNSKNLGVLKTAKSCGCEFGTVGLKDIQKFYDIYFLKFTLGQRLHQLLLYLATRGHKLLLTCRLSTNTSINKGKKTKKVKL